MEQEERTPRGEPKEKYFRIHHQIIESKTFHTLNPSAKILYITFCKLRNHFGDKNGVFFRSTSSLATDSGLSIASVHRAKTELLKAGILRWKQGNAIEACSYQIPDTKKDIERILGKG